MTSRVGVVCLSGLLAAARLLGAGSARAADAPEAGGDDGPAVHQAPQPEIALTYHEPVVRPTLAWALFQFIPSPELAVGRHRHVSVDGAVDASPKTAFGLRWQLTPVLWSFGVHRQQSRWRFFVVDPFARHSGSVELSTAFEYIGGHVDRILARPTLRGYFPLLDKGEYLSVSIGTSAYRYDGLRVAYEVGAYVLSGIVGLQVTVAPTHDPLAAIATLRLRYF